MKTATILSGSPEVNGEGLSAEAQKLILRVIVSVIGSIVVVVGIVVLGNALAEYKSYKFHGVGDIQMPQIIWHIEQTE